MQVSNVKSNAEKTQEELSENKNLDSKIKHLNPILIIFINVFQNSYQRNKNLIGSLLNDVMIVQKSKQMS